MNKSVIMKKFFSTSYADVSFNISMLILRAGIGILLFPYGFNKIQHFSEIKGKFINFLGIGSTVSLSLVVFTEIIGSLLIVLGLLTRLGALMMVIMFSVIVFKVSHADIFGKAELPSLFLLGSFTVLLLGPGKFSVDSAMGK